MNNNYIPEILKEKIVSSFKYFISIFYLFICLITFFALISFDINDNSFLTKTDLASSNLLGDFGSYYASFIFYTFGIFGYLLSSFFFIFSILTYFDKGPKYIFIRLIIFFLSLVIIPQIFIFYFEEVNLINDLNNWGSFAQNIFDIYNSKIISLIFSVLGLLLFLISQNIFSLIRVPKFKFNNIFKKMKK